jgi:hypothetical protein
MTTGPVARTWTGAVSNDAGNPGNWFPIGAPQPGDTLSDQLGSSTIDIRGKDLAGNTLGISGGAGASATLNLSHLARADVAVGTPTTVVANVSGVATLNAGVGGSNGLTPPGALRVNLDHAVLFGSFNVSPAASATVTSNDHSLLIDNQTNTVRGGNLVIDTAVLGIGTFNVTAVSIRVAAVGGRMSFGGFVSGGETVSLSGAMLGPFTATSSVTIDEPKDFHAAIVLHNFSLADLVGLAKADSWSYKNDLLSFGAANGKVIDRLHIVSDASSTGSVHGLSISKNAAGDVLVSPGTDFHGSFALPSA